MSLKDLLSGALALKQGRGLLIPRINQFLLAKRDRTEAGRYPQWTRNQREKPSRRDFRFHPSSVDANFCPRRWVIDQYSLAPDEQGGRGIDAKTMGIFELGDFMHCMGQSWLAEMGILYGRWICPRKPTEHTFWGTSLVTCPTCKSTQYLVYAEVPVDHRRSGILGHNDGEVLLPDVGRVIVDFKSANDRTFSELSTDAMDKHRHQIVQYLWARNQEDGWMSHLGERPLAAPYHTVAAAVVLYISKDTSALKEFVYRPSPALYDEVMGEKLNAFAEAQQFQKGKLDTLPTRICSNQAQGNQRRCDYVNACFTLPPLVPLTSKRKLIRG